MISSRRMRSSWLQGLKGTLMVRAPEKWSMIRRRRRMRALGEAAAPRPRAGRPAGGAARS
jgi:hypothetical protein